MSRRTKKAGLKLEKVMRKLERKDGSQWMKIKSSGVDGESNRPFSRHSFSINAIYSESGNTHEMQPRKLKRTSGSALVRLPSVQVA